MNKALAISLLLGSVTWAGLALAGNDDSRSAHIRHKTLWTAEDWAKKGVEMKPAHMLPAQMSKDMKRVSNSEWRSAYLRLRVEPGSKTGHLLPAERMSGTTSAVSNSELRSAVTRHKAWSGRQVK